MPPTRANRILLALLFLSGASSLAAQVVWAKFFAAGIGHEFPSILAVVAACLSGMAAGAAVFEQLPARWRASRRFYGGLEILIGLWIAASAWLIPWLNRAVIRALGLDPSPFHHGVVVFAAVFAALLPATAAMGATIPALERFIFGLLHSRTTGLLYGANTAGAVLGALAAAFCLMPALGLHGALLLLGALSASCGLAAVWIAGMFGNAPLSADQLPATAIPRALAVRLVCSGLLALGFEVVILRGLSHILENTVYTFAVVLAVFLAGNALGASIFHHLSSALRLSIQPAAFAVLGLACVLSGILLRWMPSFYEALRSAFGDSLPAVAAAESLTASALLLPPCVAMGFAFSALADDSLASRRSLGWSFGWNLLGSALGPVLFGLLLLPRLGLAWTLAVIGVGCCLLAGRGYCWFAGPLAGLLAIFITPAVQLVHKTPDQRIISFAQGLAASVTVLEDAKGERVLTVNNRFQMGGTAARTAQERQAAIPLLLHPNPQRALFIGLGTGMTFATAEFFPTVQADGVELLPEVARAMPFFSSRRQTPGSKPEPNRLRVHVADGRRFVQTATNPYDVVVSDLFHPALDGTAFLYTRDHYAAIRARLSGDGIFCQWLPLHQMDLEMVQIVTRTFLEIFPSADAWLLRFSMDAPVLGLISRPPNARFTGDWVERRNTPELAPLLGRLGLSDSTRLLGCILAGPAELEAFATQAPVNRDTHPIALFRAPRLTFAKTDRPSLRLIELLARFNSESALQTVLAPDQTQLASRVSAFIQSRDRYLAGLAQDESGQRPAAIRDYLESARLSPDFTAGYAQLLGIAAALSSTDRAAAAELLRQLIEARPDRPVARQMLDRLPK